MTIEDGELLFSCLCADERGARYVTESFRQDLVRTGWSPERSIGGSIVCWPAVACWTMSQGGPQRDPWQEEAPVLAGISTASVQGRRALGERAGAAVRRCGASAELLALAPSGRGPCHARGNGFDLHAAVVVPPRDRRRLERLCRYALRAPIAADRLHLTAGGQVVLDLRHPWADGTTQLLFEPVELLERLAAIMSRPWSRHRPPRPISRCAPTGCGRS
jgi:hypothetical protein